MLRQENFIGRALLALIACCAPAGAVLAQAVELTGELDVVIKEDFRHGRLAYDYFLREDGGPGWRQLVFDHAPPKSLRTGMRIKVRGVPEQARRFRVDNVAELGTGSSTVTAQADAAVLTERRVITLLVDLANAKASDDYTLAQIDGAMYTNTRSVNGVYREASLQQQGFARDTNGDGLPDVYGPFTIANDNSNCDYYAWANAAEAAAQAAGIDLAPYQHRQFVMPPYSELPACTWAGIANVGCGTFCRAWIAEPLSSLGPVMTHELGHNLNMAHAGTDPGNDGTVDAQYGDSSDPMGSSRAWHVFNAAHVDQMGWYAGQAGAVKLVTAPGGQFTLAAIGADFSSGSPKILKVAKPDSGDFYYLSYRQASAYDATLGSAYTAGINVHRYTGSGYALTSHIVTLTNGSTFSDPANAISFTQVATGGGAATVQVTYGCSVGTPTVALAPSAVTAKPGAAASFSVSVASKDSAACGSTTYTLAGTGGTVSPSAITLAAGAAGTATLTANTSLADGRYTISATATDADGVNPVHATGAQGSATLTVDGTAPAVPGNLAGSINKQGKPALTWGASTDALSGVAGYTVYRGGALLAQVTGLSYIDSGAATGVSYSYTVTARDGAGNASAASNTVTLSTGPK
ncbi:MAG: hypothetical protein ACR2I8_01420, partial [Steroidobacteraceae bacterium]